jgi:3-isopropylmalate/(R)-2-methylmalate dehydratase small subunit
MRLQGIAWRFADHVHADEACQFYKNREIPLDEREALAGIAMSGYDPDFPNRAQEGDFIVSGRNFGWGQLHSHFYASIKALGISAIIVESINDRSYREAVNSGIRVILCPSTEAIQTGEPIEIDMERGGIIRCRSGEVIPAETGAPVIEEIVERGGIDEYLRARLKEEATR